jgi:hypothetical protein
VDPESAISKPDGADEDRGYNAGNDPAGSGAMAPRRVFDRSGAGAAMALVNVSVKHGQSLDAVRGSFEKAIAEAQSRFGMWIHRVEWSPDRTSATLGGSGFELTLKYDADAVHVTGDVPFMAKLIEAPLRAFLHETFPSALPPKT